ncbi:MAG: helix-turn-helix domain-containing protein [Deltaproteobacteria bacterium]|nr:helix-turn-helix domain-containing protein [Deltaproteobacteria bacterium]
MSVSILNNLVLTVAEVAELLMLPRTKVYVMIDEGLVEAFKLGSDWRIKTSSVLHFVPR